MARTRRDDDEISPKTKPAVKARLVEEDDEGEAPRKKKKKGKKKPAADRKKTLIIGGAIAGVLFTVGCIALVVYLAYFLGGPGTSSDSPKVAYLDFFSGLEAGDAGRVWERMDLEAQNAMVKDFEDYVEKDPKGAKYKGKHGKELCLAVMVDGERPSNTHLSAGQRPIVLSQTVNGTVGSVTLKMPDQQPNVTIPCAQEEGRWKLRITKSSSESK